MGPRESSSSPSREVFGWSYLFRHGLFKLVIEQTLVDFSFSCLSLRRITGRDTEISRRVKGPHQSFCNVQPLISHVPGRRLLYFLVCFSRIFIENMVISELSVFRSLLSFFFSFFFPVGLVKFTFVPQLRGPAEVR